MDSAPKLTRRLMASVTLGFLLATLISAVGPNAQAASEAVMTPTGTYFGEYVQPRTGWSKSDQLASVQNLESYLGRTLDIDHVFFKWDSVNVFPSWRQTWDLENGRIPMISWAGTYLDQILNGSYDALIRERANGLKGLGGRVLLRWFAEMDADVYDGEQIESPAQFVAAWLYIHGIFEDEGATNVEWVWNPNAFAFGTGRAQQFYPGDSYVDWIGADGYNWAPARANSPWKSFKDAFASFYAWAAPKDQPLLIGETGVMENQPGDKAAWITDMGNTIKNVYPDIKALVYFDAYSTANFGGWYDWRVDTSASSYEAYRALANDPYFNTRSGSVDTTPPTVPSGLQALQVTAAQVNLSWAPSSDDVGVETYEVLRDGAPLATAASTTSVDVSVLPGATYSYVVRARDAAGNLSGTCSPLVLTVPTRSSGFSDGFESGSMAGWTSAPRITLRNDDAYAGSWAAEARGVGSAGSFALKVLPESSSELYARAWFKVAAQSTTMNLLRLQSADSTNIFTLFVSSSGNLMFRNDVLRTNTWSSTKVAKNAWHQVLIRVKVAGAASETEVWYDGQRIASLGSTQVLGSMPIARLIVGDDVRGRTYRTLFDDVAAGQSPLGL